MKREITHLNSFIEKDNLELGYARIFDQLRRVIEVIEVVGDPTKVCLHLAVELSQEQANALIEETVR